MTDNLSGNGLAVRYITAENTEFMRTDGGFVSVRTDGKLYPRAEFCRAFPFSAPDLFISVRETDEKHREIGIIADLNQMPDDVVKMINEQIDLRYFTPKITRIYSVKDSNGISVFDCDTDKGRCRFSMRGGSDSVTRLSETRLIFTDVDGNRFELADASKLSRKEQKKIDLYI